MILTSLSLAFTFMYSQFSVGFDDIGSEGCRNGMENCGKLC